MILVKWPFFFHDAMSLILTMSVQKTEEPTMGILQSDPALSSRLEGLAPIEVVVLTPLRLEVVHWNQMGKSK